jgi:hypothetical protein
LAGTGGEAHEAAARIALQGDDGTNDMIVSGVIRTGELQVPSEISVKQLIDDYVYRYHHRCSRWSRTAA